MKRLWFVCLCGKETTDYSRSTVSHTRNDLVDVPRHLVVKKHGVSFINECKTAVVKWEKLCGVRGINTLEQLKVTIHATLSRFISHVSNTNLLLISTKDELGLERSEDVCTCMASRGNERKGNALISQFLDRIKREGLRKAKSQTYEMKIIQDE